MITLCASSYHYITIHVCNILYHCVHHAIDIYIKLIPRHIETTTPRFNFLRVYNGRRSFINLTDDRDATADVVEGTVETTPGKATPPPENAPSQPAIQEQNSEPPDDDFDYTFDKLLGDIKHNVVAFWYCTEQGLVPVTGSISC